jgi:hypothetical protein
VRGILASGFVFLAVIAACKTDYATGDEPAPDGGARSPIDGAVVIDAGHETPTGDAEAGVGGDDASTGPCSGVICDGFETGRLSPVWAPSVTSAGAVKVVKDPQAHSGSYELQVTVPGGGAASISASVHYQNEVDVEIWLNVAAPPTTGAIAPIALVPATPAEPLYFVVEKDKVYLQAGPGSSTVGTYSADGPALGAGWHHVQLKVATLNASTQANVSVDGAAALAMAPLAPTWPISNVLRLDIGVAATFQSASASTISIDDVLVRAQ